MHHPAHTPTGPADLVLPLALLAEQAAHGPRRAPELRTAAATGPARRAARRRRAAAVRG
ncbi:hypothetical protein PUR34_06725 [Streptomyces sp. JV185]|uniref:hypothetical protein n=1 Tax=Streptomyces sp. JV185 TaxID=858638 RepID=UPI002E77EE21|nr:hypothetical protein [Streptomyces sp. JV185]MEE1767883.1 hypothetical protein [Streptomyces sp. JV185]